MKKRQAGRRLPGAMKTSTMLFIFQVVELTRAMSEVRHLWTLT
jgi:hypothetical protein